MHDPDRCATRRNSSNAFDLNACLANHQQQCAFRVERPVYEQEELNKEYDYDKQRRRLTAALCNSLRSCRPVDSLLKMFPILTWMRHYRWREDFVSDLVSGFTVAIMNIPQGMGYALLGNVPPIVGIYMAFFPVLVYVIFGTSRHVSMGTFAVISMLVAKTVSTYAPDSGGPTSSFEGNETVPYVSEQLSRYTPIQVATAVTFMVGVYQLLMHILRLGIVCTLLSETLVNGFTTGAAVHVLTSQIKDLLGMNVTQYKGPFRIGYTYIEIFSKITQSNVAAVVFSIVTILVLVGNEFLKPLVSKVSKVPVPIELLVVIAGTLVSSYTSIAKDYAVVVLGEIPTGLPYPTLPPVTLLADVAIDSFTITMVSYTTTMSMALIFAQKLSYEVDANQELLAQGAGNIFGFFFSCMPFCAALSRSVIQQVVGGKTQLASIVSCAILLCILLWIGPFFEPLPRSVLAAIIIVALKDMLLQARQLPKFWRLSILDGVVWVVTFFTVVLVDIDYGLLAGVVISLASIFFQGVKPYTCLLGVVPNTDLYLDMSKYKATVEVPSIKIFHYSGGLNFATRNRFKNELIRLVGVNPQTEFLRRKKLEKRRKATEKNGIFNVGFQEDEAPNINNNAGTEAKTNCKMESLILDFSSLSHIDPSGVNLLKTLVGEFSKIDVTLLLAGSSCPVYEKLGKCGLLGEQSSQLKIFPTVHDAVIYVQMGGIESYSIRL